MREAIIVGVLAFVGRRGAVPGVHRPAGPLRRASARRLVQPREPPRQGGDADPGRSALLPGRDRRLACRRPLACGVPRRLRAASPARSRAASTTSSTSATSSGSGSPSGRSSASRGSPGCWSASGSRSPASRTSSFPGLGAPNLGWGLAVVVGDRRRRDAATRSTSPTASTGSPPSCTALVLIGIAIIAVTRSRPAGGGHRGRARGRRRGVPASSTGSRRASSWATPGRSRSACAIVALTAELHLIWLLPVLGIVFVVEAASVVVNVTAIRRFGRRVFRASPIHHHFEELGLREQRLVACLRRASPRSAPRSPCSSRTSPARSRERSARSW